MDDEEDEIIKAVDEALEGTAQVFVPGRFLVDLIPALQYVPAWIPGAGFQRTLARWRAASTKILDLPYIKRNTAFVSTLLP